MAGDFLLLLHGRPQNPRERESSDRGRNAATLARREEGCRVATGRRRGGRRLGLFSGRGGSPPGNGWGSSGEGGRGFKMAAPFYCLPVLLFPSRFAFGIRSISRHRAETGGVHATPADGKWVQQESSTVGPECLWNWVRTMVTVTAGMRRQWTSRSRRVRGAALWASGRHFSVDRGWDQATCVAFRCRWMDVSTKSYG